MSRIVLSLAALTVLPFSLGVLAAGDAKRGAQVYRACVACVACHALEPGLHLSGPSLADLKQLVSEACETR
jgi:cytochrome c